MLALELIPFLFWVACIIADVIYCINAWYHGDTGALIWGLSLPLLVFIGFVIHDFYGEKERRKRVAEYDRRMAQKEARELFEEGEWINAEYVISNKASIALRVFLSMPDCAQSKYAFLAPLRNARYSSPPAMFHKDDIALVESVLRDIRFAGAELLLARAYQDSSPFAENPKTLRERLREYMF